MELKQRLFYSCLAVAGISLMVSFYLSQQIALALAVLVPVGLLLFAQRPALSWLAHFSLAGFIGLTAAGVMLDIPLLLMALVSTAALVSWDLLLEARAETASAELQERLHMNYLGVAVVLGLSGVGIGQWIHWRIPFIGMLILVGLMLFCLNVIIHLADQRM